MTLKRNCKESVLHYLIAQNRPFSTNDVMQNLHNEFGKTSVQKALEDLTSECKIREKTYGKQKVYSLIQEEEDSEDVALHLVALDSKIEEVNEKLKVAEQDLKKVEGALEVLENEPSTEKALNEKKELEALLIRLKDKIDILTKTSSQMTVSDKKALKNYEYYTKEHRKRKQICMDIVNSIIENYPKKLKALFEEIGIDSDDTS